MGKVKRAFPCYFFYKITQHSLCLIKICDHSVFERPNCDDMPRCSSQHTLGLIPDCLHNLTIDIKRNHRWFTQEDAFPVNVDECIGGAQINPHAATPTKKTKKTHSVFACLTICPESVLR